MRIVSRLVILLVFLPNTGESSSANRYAVGTFHHVASVVNRTDGNIKIYVDGELKETQSFTAGETTWDYGSNRWRIGVSYPGFNDYGHPCDGVVDEAQLFNRALSADEVTKLYESGLPKGLRILKWAEVR